MFDDEEKKKGDLVITEPSLVVDYDLDKRLFRVFTGHRILHSRKRLNAHDDRDEILF